MGRLTRRERRQRGTGDNPLYHPVLSDPAATVPGMPTRDDNLRFLRRRAAEPAPGEGPVRIREGGEALLVEFQGQDRAAELLRAAADWLEAHPGATAVALNLQVFEDTDHGFQQLLELVIQG